MWLRQVVGVFLYKTSHDLGENVCDGDQQKRVSSLPWEISLERNCVTSSRGTFIDNKDLLIEVCLDPEMVF